MSPLWNPFGHLSEEETHTPTSTLYITCGENTEHESHFYQLPRTSLHVSSSWDAKISVGFQTIGHINSSLIHQFGCPKTLNQTLLYYSASYLLREGERRDRL